MTYILSKQKESPSTKNCISDEVQDKDLMSTRLVHQIKSL